MIRTIWFMLAIIPLLTLTFVLAVFSLVVTSPLIVYAGIKGKHLKDNRRDGLIFHEQKN